MRIGYAVQGSTDRAFLFGLKDRWCEDAEMIEGAFRGSTGLSLRRELAKICKDLFWHKSCDVLVIVSDADVANWRTVQRREVKKLPDDMQSIAIYGMADRNIECWLCADPHYIAEKTGRAAVDFDVDDPSGAFKSAIDIAEPKHQKRQIITLGYE